MLKRLLLALLFTLTLAHAASASPWGPRRQFIDENGVLLASTTVLALLETQALNFKTDFGAAIDGSTDDSKEWNNAMAAVPNGGTLYVPPGTAVGKFSIRRNNITIYFDGTTLRHPSGAPGIVLELGDTASGNSAEAYENINVLGRVLLDGNKANVMAPSSDLVGHCFAATKIQKSYWQQVRAKDCHNAGAGIFIDSNYNEGHFYVESSGNATFTGPGFDINSSKYGYYTFTSKDSYDGGRILDNAYGNVIRGIVYNARRHGFICQNQSVNESYINNIDVAIDTVGANGFGLGANCRNNTIRANIKNAGNTGFNATLFAAATKTFDGSSVGGVSTANDTITIAMHGFNSGQPIVYGPGHGTVIAGLAGGETYYAMVVDGDTLKLATTRANALAGIVVDLTALGTGTSHALISDQSARSNTITVNTFRSTNQGVYMGGVNNDWTITSDQDGRGGAVGDNFAVDINGNYNSVRVNLNDTSPWKVRGIAVRAGATENAVTSYQYTNTADPYSDWGTRTRFERGTGKGSDVASAATVTLPTLGSVVTITGTAEITFITAAGNAGRTVTLVFADRLTVTDGSNLLLNGNFTTSPNATLTLMSDGTHWYEIARSANKAGAQY